MNILGTHKHFTISIMMIACHAFTNTQILNLANAKINLYPDDHADLYIYMGKSISSTLIDAVRSSRVFENVYCLDPFIISASRVPVIGRIPKIGKIGNVGIKWIYLRAYKQLLEHLNNCKNYDRAILTWFYAENVFLLYYWSKGKKDFKISFLDEGTGSYCYTEKQMMYSKNLMGSRKDRLRKYLAEHSLSKRLIKYVDSIILYQPEMCRPDIHWKKIKLPAVNEQSNPIMCDILRSSVKNLDMIHYMQYEKRNAIYLSTYSVEGAPFDLISLKVLELMEYVFGEKRVVAKIHTGNTAHKENFAKSFEKRLFVDREKYIFEGLYMQLPNRGKKLIVSCISTAAIYPKFMFDEEPYVIFTYRLYDTYRQCGVERDDWMASKVIKAYSDKSKVMIPNSFDELRQMLKKMIPKICEEYWWAENSDVVLGSEEVLDSSAREVAMEHDINEQTKDK